jgi:peptide/nickel transport system ATP-binding protein
MASSAEPVLAVENLTVTARMEDGRRAHLINDVSFEVPAGGSLGLVGESGSGKTMTGLAILGLLPKNVRVTEGRILFAGEDLLKASPSRMRRIRGKQISMVLQDSLTALDPCFTVRNQLSEPLRRHRHLHGRALHDEMVVSLERVHLPAAEERLSQFPHQLSGGMRQRVTSAIALAGEPKLLIADEPTTALDGTTQARYLRVLRELQETNGFALVFVSHDLFLIHQICARIAVMYASQIVEQGPIDTVFDSPCHPYTRALIGAIPDLAAEMHLESIEGQAPDPFEEIAGCRFASRCKHSREICTTEQPGLTDRPVGSLARCWATEEGGWL